MSYRAQRYEYSDGRPVRAVFRASKFNKRGPHAAAAVRFGGPGHVATVASRDGTLAKTFMRSDKTLVATGRQMYLCVKCKSMYKAGRKRKHPGPSRSAAVSINERTREVFCVGGDPLDPDMHNINCTRAAPKQPVENPGDHEPPEGDSSHWHTWLTAEESQAEAVHDVVDADQSGDSDTARTWGPAVATDLMRSSRYELPDGRPVRASYHLSKMQRMQREQAQAAAGDKELPPWRGTIATVASRDGERTCQFMRKDTKLIGGARHLHFCTRCNYQYKVSRDSGATKAYVAIDWQNREVYVRGGNPFAAYLHHANCGAALEAVEEPPPAARPKPQALPRARPRPVAAARLLEGAAIDVVTTGGESESAGTASASTTGTPRSVYVRSSVSMSGKTAGILLVPGRAALLTTARRCIRAKPAKKESAESKPPPETFEVKRPETKRKPAVPQIIDEAELRRMHGAESLLAAFRRACPPNMAPAHKGQAGRVAVVGGSEEYCGAPYFAGITAMKCGADLSHVMCPPSAAQVIKSYSPDLIVHPILPDSAHVDDGEWRSQLDDWFGRVDAIALGPGLGRSEQAAEVVAVVTEIARRRQLPIVLDADALWYVGQSPGTVRGNEQATLTPNVVELVRLLAAVAERECTVAELTASTQRRNELAQLLASQLGGCTVVAKGHTDYATDGTYSLECSVEGSVRRCGGQGDMLAGALALFQAWTDKRPADVAHASPSTIAAFAASAVVRRCAWAAFERRRRSTVTADMVAALPAVVAEVVGEGNTPV